MTVAGIMSGTSADGIDVAFTRITPRAEDPASPDLKLLAHAGFPFPPALRRAVLAAMNAEAIATAELARLNWRLGQAYSEALAAALERNPCRLDLIGCHGQTIYHQATPARYLGRDAACTWQIGEMAMLAEQSGVPVVSNFRPGRHGGWRAGCSPGSSARLRALSPPDAGPRAAESGRHRQPDGAARQRRALAGGGLRYRPGKHGDRSADAAAFWQAVRPRRKDGQRAAR